MTILRELVQSANAFWQVNPDHVATEQHMAQPAYQEWDAAFKKVIAFLESDNAASEQANADKAAKWDALDEKISKFYNNEEGEYDEENPEADGDLGTIGEIAATAFGYL